MHGQAWLLIVFFMGLARIAFVDGWNATSKYLCPRVEEMGKRPVWSINISPTSNTLTVILGCARTSCRVVIIVGSVGVGGVGGVLYVWVATLLTLLCGSRAHGNLLHLSFCGNRLGQMLA